MSTLYSPKVPTDGLIMCLDAANPKSLLSRVELLIVGGGGGGGMDMGGGGGGGGVVYSQSYQLSSIFNPITVTVGDGGAGAPAANTGGQPGGHQYTVSAQTGGSSIFDGVFAYYGGYGASSYWGYTPDHGYAGGGASGGGASGFSDGTGNGGVAGAGGRYGNAIFGTQGYRGGGGTGQCYSGGGGGAGGIGGEGAYSGAPYGGPGVRCDILGYPLYWGGGGGGAGFSTYGGVGGIGGGGGGAVVSNVGGAGYNNGAPGGAGTTNAQANVPGGNGGTNTGGGGGGGSHYSATNAGGNGGSGIVIVKYPGAPKATGGTIVQAGGSTLHIFLSSGTFTPNVWKDVVGSNDATFYASPSWSPTYGGVFVTTAAGGRAETNLNLSSGTYTIIAASRYTGGTSGRVITAIVNNWLLGQWSATSNPYYAEGWVNNGTIGADTTWRIYAGTGDTVNDAWKFYINGVIAANNNGGSQGPYRLTVGMTRETSDAQVGFVLAYNRVLTDSEIYQVFNAHRGRFGL